MNHECRAYVYCNKIYYNTLLNTEFMIQVPVVRSGAEPGFSRAGFDAKIILIIITSRC